MSRPEATPEWYSISAVLGGDPAPPWALALATWICGTMAVSLPALGRAGALCPFVPRALKLASLFTCDGKTDRPSDIQRVIETAAHNFSTTCPLKDEADHLKALIVAFPTLQRRHWPALKRARTAVKPAFIADGLTLSEFHDESDDRSVRNQRICIGRSPVPSIIIRRLQIHDEIFLRSQPTLYPIFLQRLKASLSND